MELINQALLMDGPVHYIRIIYWEFFKMGTDRF